MESIRKAYKAYVKPAGPCLDPDVLEAFYSDRLPPNRMEDVRAHLASCPACLETARDYCVFRGISAMPDRAAAPQRRWYAQPWMQAAAGIILIVAATLLWVSNRVPQNQTVTRGVAPIRAVVAVSPKGTLQAAPQQLEWEPMPSATLYEVEIQNTQFQVIWRREGIKDTHVSLPADVVSRLESGTFGWRIIAMTGDGRYVASPITSFEVQH